MRSVAESREAARGEWRALISAAAKCAADPARDVVDLKAIARRARAGLLWPTADRDDQWALNALRQTADSYAHQRSIRRRARMGLALGMLAVVAAEIMDAGEPAARRAPEPAPRRLPYKED
jgi:hypothetical protein